MTATYATIAPSRLTVGMTIRQTVRDIPGDYEVIEVIHERMNRKLYVHTVCRPLDNAHRHPLNRPLFHAGKKPVVKSA